ncbi:MAG: hypothetical protein Q9162_002494 [Coniocarpon cinnabarinum]
MFTGIVETIGTISHLETPSTGTTLTIASAPILTDAHLGDSISVNGTCLTITHLIPETAPHTSFKVGIAPETLRRTNLGRLKAQDSVNLERALLPGTRLGGHFLQGHVDAVAAISAKKPDGEAIVFRFEPRDKSLLRYVIEKGYVAVDGASLTVTAVGESWFEVMLISYTQEKVVTALKSVGDEVNVEVDMVGKYVERSLEGYLKGDEQALASGPLGRVVEQLVKQELSKR